MSLLSHVVAHSYRSKRARVFVWLLFGVGLFLAWPGQLVDAQQQQSVPFPVPPASTLRATLDGRTADVKVEDTPKILERRFGRKEQGQFVAYSQNQPMPYDRPFVIQVRFSSEPSYNQTTVPITWEKGGRMEIPVYKNNADPKIFESEEHPFEDPSACRGLRFCVEGAKENLWTLGR